MNTRDCVRFVVSRLDNFLLDRLVYKLTFFMGNYTEVL